MKVRLIFDEWLTMDHKSTHGTPKDIELTSGSFHSGTTFEAQLNLDADSILDLTRAAHGGFRAQFVVDPNSVLEDGAAQLALAFMNEREK